MKKLKPTKYTPGNKKVPFFADVKKKHILLPILAVLLVIALIAGCVIAMLRDASRVVLTKVTVTHSQIPASFDGYRILQISDLYGKEFGDRQSRIRKALEGVEYDMILFTGDFLSSAEDTDYWAVRDLMDCLNTNVPIYYIVGDNDYKPANVSEDNDRWKMCIKPAAKTEFMQFFEREYGAVFVYPAQRIESSAGESIYLTGIEYNKEILNNMDFDQDTCFSICVTHKPINYNVSRRLKDVNKRTFTEVDYDLSVSGHTFGGQYRLPLLGAVYSEDEGWFPQESSVRGLSSDGDGRWNYINGGLGTASGIRIFSTPEISLIELKCAPQADEK